LKKNQQPNTRPGKTRATKAEKESLHSTSPSGQVPAYMCVYVKEGHVPESLDEIKPPLLHFLPCHIKKEKREKK
jgi:hypothetical protein